MKTEKQMAVAAAEFAERWKGRGYERGESQPFWIDLLSNVYGIETPSDAGLRLPREVRLYGKPLRCRVV